MVTSRSSTDDIHPIRRQRRLQKLTQAELGQAVGASRQTIIAIEQGDYAPSVYLALRIAQVLGSTVEELFLENDNNPETMK